jgi:hypothetical protein
MEFHPQWLRNVPVDGGARTRAPAALSCCRVPAGPMLNAEASSEHVEDGGLQFPNGVDEDRIGIAA